MATDVVVSASTKPEAFGRVVAEAQAMGRPVVAPSHGAAGEIIIPGVTGWLFTPGDAVSMADALERALALNQVAPVRPVHAIPRMGQVVKEMIKDVLDAYVNGDVPKAVRVWNRDEELDEMYSSLFRELLTYMMEDARNITASTHLLFIAKNIERIGDHATNIAEMCHFLVHGGPMRESRPRASSGHKSPVQQRHGA